MSEFSRDDKLKCVMREIAIRRHVYPGWIARGKIKAAEAAREIAIMLAIAKDYGGHGDETKK